MMPIIKKSGGIVGSNLGHGFRVIPVAFLGHALFDAGSDPLSSIDMHLDYAQQHSL